MEISPDKAARANMCRTPYSDFPCLSAAALLRQFNECQLVERSPADKLSFLFSCRSQREVAGCVSAWPQKRTFTSVAAGTWMKLLAL